MGDGDQELARHAGGGNDAQLAYNPFASCGRRLRSMKRHWVLAVARSLAAVGAPPASTAAGAEDASGGAEIRSSYEQAVRRVESAEYEDALKTLKALNRSEPGDAGILDMLGYTHRKLGRVEAAFGYCRDALPIVPRHLEANKYLGELYLETGKFASAAQCLGSMRTLDRLDKSLASVS